MSNLWVDCLTPIEAVAHTLWRGKFAPAVLAQRDVGATAEITHPLADLPRGKVGRAVENLGRL